MGGVFCCRMLYLNLQIRGHLFLRQLTAEGQPVQPQLHPQEVLPFFLSCNIFRIINITATATRAATNMVPAFSAKNLYIIRSSSAYVHYCAESRSCQFTVSLPKADTFCDNLREATKQQ